MGVFVRLMRSATVALAAALVLGACGRAEERRPLTTPPPPAVTPGTVLTAEDMERLVKERDAMVQRPSALREEVDEVSRVRDQVLRNSGMKK